MLQSIASKLSKAKNPFIGKNQNISNSKSKLKPYLNAQMLKKKEELRKTMKQKIKNNTMEDNSFKAKLKDLEKDTYNNLEQPNLKKAKEYYKSYNINEIKNKKKKIETIKQQLKELTSQNGQLNVIDVYVQRHLTSSQIPSTYKDSVDTIKTKIIDIESLIDSLMTNYYVSYPAKGTRIGGSNITNSNRQKINNYIEKNKLLNKISEEIKEELDTENYKTTIRDKLIYKEMENYKKHVVNTIYEFVKEEIEQTIEFKNEQTELNELNNIYSQISGAVQQLNELFKDLIEHVHTIIGKSNYQLKLGNGRYSKNWGISY